MRNPTLRKGPPRSGLIPVRVFVSGGRVRAHTRIVYKKPGEDIPQEVRYIGPMSEKHKLHTVGRTTHMEQEREYPAIIYVCEEDLARLLNPGEQKLLDARIRAEHLLTNFGHTEKDLKGLKKELRSRKAELVEEQTVSERTGKKTADVEEKLKTAIVKLKERIATVEEHFEETLVEISPGRKKRIHRPKTQISDVEGLGLNVSSEVLTKLNRRVEKMASTIRALFFEHLDTDEYDQEDLRKTIEDMIVADADEITKRKGMFGFLATQQGDSPRMPTDDSGVGETEKDLTQRWIGIRSALKKTLIWHMTKIMSDMYPDVLGTAVDVTEHPYTEEHTTGPSLPETARGEAFSLTRKVASGELLIPVIQTTQVSRSKRHVNNKADKRLFGQVDQRSGKRYLTSREYDTLIAELMGVRMLVWDKNGIAVPTQVDLPTDDIKYVLSKKMWQGGFMDTIIPIVKTAMRTNGVTQQDFQRVMGAAMTGMMSALVSYGSDLGKENPDYEKDPALALMVHVASMASDHAETEVYNILGEQKGVEYLAHLTVQQATGGSFGRLKKIALIDAEAKRRLVARGVFEEPTIADHMEAAETFKGQFFEFIPASIRKKDPDAALKWVKDQLTRGLELDHFTEDPVSGDVGSTGVSENSGRMPVGKMLSEASQWYNMMYRGGPKTMGQVGASSHEVREYERDDLGNIVRGTRDNGTGRIIANPSGFPVLKEEWLRDNDGTFKREPLRDERGEIVRIQKDELSALDIYRDKHGTYRRPNGNLVPNPEPHSVKYEETNRGDLVVLDHLVPNPDAHHTWVGGTIISPLQMEVLEIAAHVRHAVFERLANPNVGDKYKFTAEDARIIDMVYFRGMAFDPYQEYHDEHDELNRLHKELAELKGLVDPIHINDDIKVAYGPYIEAFTGKAPKLGSTVTNFEISVGSAVLRMEKEGATASAVEGHKLKALSKLRTLRKERDAIRDQYNDTTPQVFYPDAASPSMCTQGMLNFPGIPVDDEGNPNRKVLKHYLGEKIVSKLGKKSDYDVALHIALRRELASSKYGQTTSIFRPEDLDNPDLRKAARIFFDTGELPAEVAVARLPGGKYEYEERVVPRKHGLRTRVTREGGKVLEHSEVKFVFPPGGPILVAGERQPLVYDSTTVGDDGELGKMVPMYSVLDDEKVLSALADVQRIKGLITRRGFFDKDNPTLPIIQELKKNEPELFVSGPPSGRSKYLLEETIDSAGDTKVVVHKQEFTREKLKEAKERITLRQKRVTLAAKGSEKLKQAKKALKEAQVLYTAMAEYLDQEDAHKQAWSQRMLEFRHGIHEWPREPRGEAGRSRKPDVPVFSEKERRDLTKWVVALKAGKDPAAEELERWMSGYMARSPAQEKSDLKQINDLERQLSRAGDPKRRKSIQGKINILTTRTFDAVKVHKALLSGWANGSDFSNAYSRLLSELNITTNAVWDSHSILMYEADVAFRQAVTAKDPTHGFDPSGHSEVVTSREMRHPLLRFISTDHVMATIQAINDNQIRVSGNVVTDRSEVRKVLHVLSSVQEAYQRDSKGKILRDPKTKEPLLRPDVTPVPRQRRGKATKRGLAFQEQQANEPTEMYTEYQAEVSRVLPKTVKRERDQVVRATVPKPPGTLPPPLEGKIAFLPREYGRGKKGPSYTGSVAGEITLRPPSEIPSEAPPQSMAHIASVKGFDKNPLQMGRVFPPVKTKIARTGACAVEVYKTPSNEVRPVDSVMSEAKAREWSAHIRIAPTLQPKYKKPSVDTPVHVELTPTEPVSEAHEKFLAARQVLTRELKYQHRLKSEGKAIPRTRSALLEKLQADYRALIGTTEKTQTKRHIAEVPSYKEELTVSGKPKFAFSDTIHIFGVNSVLEKDSHVG